MTTPAPGLPEVPALEPAPPTSSPTASVHASFGVVVGGTPSGDVILLSHRALAIVRAGQMLRAFVIVGLETLRRTVALGAGRTLRLQHGMYQVV
jgi:hypothetical protein